MEFRYIVSPDGREMREACVNCEHLAERPCYNGPYSEGSQGLNVVCERVEIPVTNEEMDNINH